MEAGFGDVMCVHPIKNLNKLTHSHWTQYACRTNGGYLVIFLISYTQ
jgi:hypothetical protein